MTAARPRTAVFLLAIAFTVLAAYAVMLGSPFKTMDDVASIVENPWIKTMDWTHVRYLMTHSFFEGDAYYRPLISLSFMLEHRLVGLQAWAYYLNNMLVHILTAFTVFFLMRRLWAKETLAFCAALLFAVHPMQWEAVSNIPGRAILLCALFYLQAVLWFTVRREKPWAWALSLACFVLALLSKESAGMLPAVLFFYLILVENRRLKDLAVYLSLVPYVLVCFAYLAWRHSLGITKLFHWRNVQEAVLGFITFLNSVIQHLSFLIYPRDFVFDRSQPLFMNFADGDVWLTLFFFIAAAVLLWKAWGRWPRTAYFFIAWFFIELFPVSQLLVSIGVQPGYIMTADHFLYTAIVGFSAAAVLAVDRIRERLSARRAVSPAVFRWAVVGIFAFLFLVNLQNNIYSSNEIAMFERTLKYNPANTRIRNSLAFAYASIGRFEDAERHFRETLDADPLNTRARIGLGKALIDEGKYWEGLAEYDRVYDPGGMVDLLAENKRLTLQFLERQYLSLLAASPENPAILYSLGVVFARQGRVEDAIRQYGLCLARDPRNRNALFNLASAHAALGRSAEAARLYQDVLALPGDDELARLAREYLGQTPGGEAPSP